MNKVTIKYKGKEIDCYGEWLEDSNALVVGDGPWGDFEEFYCDGGANWTEVVKTLVDAPSMAEVEIIELTAC